MEPILGHYFSIAKLRELLEGEDSQVVYSTKASHFDEAGKLIPVVYELTRRELRDAVSRVYYDKTLASEMLDYARQASERVRAGAVMSERPYPFIGRIDSHIANSEAREKRVCSTFIGHVASSCVVRNFEISP
jgi:hypothetical protein